MKRYFLCLVICCLFCCFFFSLSVVATEVDSQSELDFRIDVSATEVELGETLKITLYYIGEEEVSGFLVGVNYDTEVFEFYKVEKGDIALNNYAQSNDIDGTTLATFASQGESFVNGEVFVFYYKAKTEYAKEVSSFTVDVTQVIDENGDTFPETLTLTSNVAIAPLPSTSCYLLELAPNYGSLNETFYSDVYDYTMSVPYEITSMEFYWVTSDGATASINRKNLGSGGSELDFNITVTAEDGETKNIYTVMVTRGEYVYSSSTSSSSTSSGSSGSSTSSGTSNSSSSTSSETVDDVTVEYEDSSEIDTYSNDVLSTYNDSTGLVIQGQDFWAFFLGIIIGVGTIVLGQLVIYFILKPYLNRVPEVSNVIDEEEVRNITISVPDEGFF